jgi:hypothetical protein
VIVVTPNRFVDGVERRRFGGTITDVDRHGGTDPQ